MTGSDCYPGLWGHLVDSVECGSSASHGIPLVACCSRCCAPPNLTGEWLAKEEHWRRPGMSCRHRCEFFAVVLEEKKKKEKRKLHSSTLPRRVSPYYGGSMGLFDNQEHGLIVLLQPNASISNMLVVKTRRLYCRET